MVLSSRRDARRGRKWWAGSYPGLLSQLLLLIHLVHLARLLGAGLLLLLWLGRHEALQELLNNTGLDGDDHLAKVLQALHVL